MPGKYVCTVEDTYEDARTGQDQCGTDRQDHH